MFFLTGIPYLALRLQFGKGIHKLTCTYDGVASITGLRNLKKVSLELKEAEREVVKLWNS